MKINYQKAIFWMAFMPLLLTQAKVQAQATVGIRAGLNVTNITLDNLPNKSERFGFHAGIFAHLPVVADFMSLQPELSFSTKGAAFEVLNERQTLNMNYVDFLLPVAFKLGSIDIQVGPFASYLISTPDYTLFEDNTVVLDAFKKFDAGLTAGLSYNFNKMLIGIRYNQGFMDVTKDNAKLILGSGKNAVGQVSLGFRF